MRIAIRRRLACCREEDVGVERQFAGHRPNCIFPPSLVLKAILRQQYLRPAGLGCPQSSASHLGHLLSD